MGNACGCADSNVGEVPVTSITQKPNQLEPFKLAAAPKTPIGPEAFSALSPADKDAVLVEVLRLIVAKGDAAQIKTNNVHLKRELMKQTQKIVTNGEIFDGEVIDGVANGRGKVKLTNGGDFEGYFIGGFRRAKGVTKHPNIIEESFYGEEGQQEGASVHKAANGSFQTFFNERGLRSGPGFSDSATEQQFELFIANRKNGFTVKVTKDHKTLSLQDFKDDKAVAAPIEYVLKQAQPAPPAPQPAQDGKPADPKAAPQPAQDGKPADPKAAPQPAQDGKPAQPAQDKPADPKAAPQPAPAQDKPSDIKTTPQGAPAQDKSADGKAAAPQEKSPAPAPPAPGNPAPVKQTQGPGPQKP
jgi:hypothetical protein